MNYTQHKILKGNFHSTSFMCPNCLEITTGGVIKFNIEMELPAFADPSNIDIHPVGILCYPQIDNAEAVLRADQVVTAICPECGHKMIAVDTGIVKMIARYNHFGFWTMHSCEGHDNDILDGSRYITIGSAMTESELTFFKMCYAAKYDYPDLCSSASVIKIEVDNLHDQTTFRIVDTPLPDAIKIFDQILSELIAINVSERDWQFFQRLKYGYKSPAKEIKTLEEFMISEKLVFDTTPLYQDSPY